MPAERTYVEGSTAPDLDEIYRRRHSRLANVGRFVRFVAEGGMGAILEVQGDDLGVGEGRDRFALKLIKESLLGDTQAVDRFRRELQSHHRFSEQYQLARLVPCLAFADDEDPRRIFGLFPFYPEGTLDDLVRQGLPAAEALAILADAVEGLQLLHGRQYVHRDFHPSNILVEGEGGRRRGVLGDLGVGMFLESNTIFSNTQLDADRGRKAGHRGFIDPYCQASPAADLFSVGATLYRILTGRTPGGTKLPTPGPLSLPEDLGRAYSAKTRRLADRVLRGLTAPETGDRYPALRPVRAAIVELIERIGPGTGSGTVNTGVGRAALRRTSRRRRGRILPAALVAVALVGGYGLWEWRTGDPPPDRGTVELSETEPPEGEVPGRGAGDPLPVDDPAEDRPAEDAHGPEVTEPAAAEVEKTPEPRPPPPRPAPPPPPPTRRQPEARPEDRSTDERPAVTEVAAREILEADGLIRRREYGQAEKLLTSLLAEHPGDPEVAGRLARILPQNHGAAGYRQARDVLADALDRHPERGDLRLALARVLMQQERPADARRRLREAPPGSSHRDEIEALAVTLGDDRDL